MDDGGRGTGGQLILHTNSYKLEEVKDLIKVLKQKFELECWEINTRQPPMEVLVDPRPRGRKDDQWAILIPKRELPKIRELVTPYIHKSMVNKIESD